MDKQSIAQVMELTMTKIKEMVDVNTIVGDQITTPDGITLIPVSTVTFGFGAGGADGSPKESQNVIGTANGAGIKITPVAFIVIKEGSVRMLNIAPPAGTTVDRLVELIPVVWDKVQDFVESRKGGDE